MMPTISISASDWQLLRRLNRAAKPLAGRELRMFSSSNTKGGTFLRLIEARGLISRDDTTLDEPAKAGEPKEYRMWWKLTEPGRVGAEYGMYNAKPEGDWPAESDQSEVTNLP
jgi:hypothetical protein